MRTTLNLATRPVRNERLPALLFGIAALALLLVTVQHAFVAYRLLPGRSQALRDEVAALLKENEVIATESGKLRGVRASPQQEAEWVALRSLIDRRTFWWSRLFGVLEETLPPEVRLLSVLPQLQEGERELFMTVRVQNTDAGYAFMRALEGRPEFADVAARSVATERGEDPEFQLKMRYLSEEPKDEAPPPGGAPPAPVSTPAREARAAAEGAAR